MKARELLSYDNEKEILDLAIAITKSKTDNMLTDNLKGKVKEIWDVLEKEALVSKMRSIVENNAVHRDIDVLRHTQRRLTYFLRNCTWDYSEDPLSTYLDKNSMVNLQKRINSNLNLISRPGKGWLRVNSFGIVKLTNKKRLLQITRRPPVYTQRSAKRYRLFSGGEDSYYCF